MSHQSDLPPHVPSCVSTGAGVTVPDATATPSFDIGAVLDEIIPVSSEQAISRAEVKRRLVEAFSLITSAKASAAHEYLKRAERAERELTAAKAEIARLDELNRGAAMALKANSLSPSYSREAMAIETAAVLQADNAQLRAEVERWKESYDGACQAEDVLSICVSVAEEDNDQLRARVVDLESQLADCATKAAAEYGEQLKPLFAKVRELEAAVAWAEQQLLGDSGTGETYWETVPGYAAFKRAARAGKGRP